jgi:hypothetical protein
VRATNLKDCDLKSSKKNQNNLNTSLKQMNQETLDAGWISFNIIIIFFQITCHRLSHTVSTWLLLTAPEDKDVKLYEIYPMASEYKLSKP